MEQDAQPSGSPQYRNFGYDGLGRMISETTPESGNTVFTYGSASACASGSYPGSLVEKVDNMGNVTCIAHDALGRVTSITYPSGPYDTANGVTPMKTFVYDAATVDGQVMPNALGRLAEAYTGPASAKITDEGFGYDTMGRPSDLWENVPGSDGWYHIPVTYFYNGQLASIAATGLPYFTYNVDNQGRVVSTNNASPVSAVDYNPAGQVTALRWASGDLDTYAYDPGTGQMTQYQFTVNGATDTGSLTWNSGGSLGKLVIADNIPGTSDSQTCTYTHDDLGRLSGVTCGSLWQQTFTLDAFGNLKKSGSLNWQPVYSAATNQANISYDGDGNVTGDGSHTYAWDAAGKLIRVDSTALARDALGRMVGSYYGPVEYLPGGRKLAIMSGQNGAGMYFPLPGGAKAFDLGGTWLEVHGDWLASARLTTNPGSLYRALSYAPYGAMYADSAPGAASQWFTGVDSDVATGLSDFPFREYSSTQGRWLSPDPAGLAAVNPADPQTWNAYAYVANQPLSATDPLGLVVPCGPCGGGGGGYGIPVGEICAGLLGGPQSCFGFGDWVNPVDVSGELPSSSNDFGISSGGPLTPSLRPSAGGGRPGISTSTRISGPGCSQYQKEAGAVADGLEAVSRGFGWAAAGGTLATFVSALGEAPSLGLDSPLTLALGSATGALYEGSAYAGAAAASLRSFADGNLEALGNFDWSHLAGYAAEAAAARIPGLEKLGQVVGGLAEQAASLALAAREVCQ